MKRTRLLVTSFYSFFSLNGGMISGFGICLLMHRQESGVFQTVGGGSLDRVLSVGPVLLIILGFVLMLLGITGSCGTLNKKSWMLLVFFIGVVIIFILQLCAAVFLLLPDSVKEKTLSNFDNKMVKSLQKDYEDSQTNIWYKTMTELKCCGYKGYEDFRETPSVMKSLSYPKQCCGHDSTTSAVCPKEAAMKEKVRGCIYVLLEKLLPISGALCFLIAVLEIVAMFVSLRVYRLLRRSPDSSESD